MLKRLIRFYLKKRGRINLPVDCSLNVDALNEIKRNTINFEEERDEVVAVNG